MALDVAVARVVHTLLIYFLKELGFLHFGLVHEADIGFSVGASLQTLALVVNHNRLFLRHSRFTLHNLHTASPVIDGVSDIVLTASQTVALGL